MAEISKFEEAEATRMADYAKRGITLAGAAARDRTPGTPTSAGTLSGSDDTLVSPFEPRYQSTQRVKVDILFEFRLAFSFIQLMFDP